MPKYTQKYTLIMPLEPLAAGIEYASTNWPLHITLADTFAIDWGKDGLREQLANLLISRQPVRAVASHDEWFGAQHHTQVTILTMSSELISLHNDVVTFLEKHSAVFNNPEYHKDGYRAHATVQSHKRVTEGETITCSTVALIDMFPHGDPYQRAVLALIPLMNS